MTPQALGKARTIPSEQQARILDLRRSGKTIAEICIEMEYEGTAKMAAVQDVCLRHFGKRDYRGPELGPLPGKSPSSRHRMAP